MMYLVLTALLALNVSKEVLNSFFEVNRGIERTTESFTSKNDETRIAVTVEEKLDDYEIESEKQIAVKGNVYLAKITRVEPSLQAAFVEYGGNRQGFLAFSEIHPDYYRIPIEDREAIIEAEVASQDDDAEDAPEDGTPETVGGESAVDEDIRPKRQVKKYKIQEVISKKQIMLVQVVKEERGNLWTAF